MINLWKTIEFLRPYSDKYNYSVENEPSFSTSFPQHDIRSTIEATVLAVVFPQFPQLGVDLSHARATIVTH